MNQHKKKENIDKKELVEMKEQRSQKTEEAENIMDWTKNDDELMTTS